jgi:hypothetical protein
MASSLYQHVDRHVHRAFFADAGAQGVDNVSRLSQNYILNARALHRFAHSDDSFVRRAIVPVAPQGKGPKVPNINAGSRCFDENWLLIAADITGK